MEQKSLSLVVSEQIGQVSAEYIIPSQVTAVMTFAHGAGAGMHHSFMASMARALAEAGIATLRFNFPFMENKGRRADVPAVAHATIAAAITQAHGDFPSVPLFAAGKSFGGRMTSQYIAANAEAPVNGLAFFGFPLHPSGKPGTERAEHLKNINIQMLFLQGTRDELAEWSLIESVCASLPTATLVRIEGADHLFKAGKKNIIQLLKDETEHWLSPMVS